MRRKAKDISTELFLFMPWSKIKVFFAQNYVKKNRGNIGEPTSQCYVYVPCRLTIYKAHK